MVYNQNRRLLIYTRWLLARLRSSLARFLLLLRLSKNLSCCESAFTPSADEIAAHQHFCDDVGAIVGDCLGAHGGTFLGQLVRQAVDAYEALVGDGRAVVDGNAFGGGVVEHHVGVLDERIASLVAGVDDGYDCLVLES